MTHTQTQTNRVECVHNFGGAKPTTLTQKLHISEPLYGFITTITILSCTGWRQFNLIRNRGQGRER